MKKVINSFHSCQEQAKQLESEGQNASVNFYSQNYKAKSRLNNVKINDN
jgi:hypothetical protein